MAQESIGDRSAYNYQGRNKRDRPFCSQELEEREMKRTLLFAAAAVALAGLAWAQARRPVNRKCPLKPSVRIDIAQTVIYNGKVVGLCCSDCTDKWKKNPAAYASALKEDANIPV